MYTLYRDPCREEILYRLGRDVHVEGPRKTDGDDGDPNE